MFGLVSEQRAREGEVDHNTQFLSPFDLFMSDLKILVRSTFFDASARSAILQSCDSELLSSAHLMLLVLLVVVVVL